MSRLPIQSPQGTPIDRAIEGAMKAGTVGQAFVAGYQAALRALVPELTADARVALCATEEGGAHPRAIATRLESRGEGFVLTGRKHWVTGGTRAGLLLVVASVGTDDKGRNRLRVVRVDPKAPGVTIEPLPPTPFVPDVPHAAVSFESVVVAARDVLEGDGYERYLKPFRTIEDLHVHGAVLAHVLALGLAAGWPAGIIEEGCALLVATRALAASDPAAKETHLALAGLLALSRALLERTRAEWPSLDGTTRSGLERDLALLEVAGRVRAQRTATAWAAVTADSGGGVRAPSSGETA